MHLDIARISFFFRGQIFGDDWGSNEQSNTHGNLSWGSKVGQIRSYGTSNMVLIACFQRFFFIFCIPPPPPQKKKKKRKKKTTFPLEFF